MRTNVILLTDSDLTDVWSTEALDITYPGEPFSDPAGQMDSPWGKICAMYAKRLAKLPRALDTFLA
jgi:hypothetical protein